MTICDKNLKMSEQNLLLSGILSRKKQNKRLYKFLCQASVKKIG